MQFVYLTDQSKLCGRFPTIELYSFLTVLSRSSRQHKIEGTTEWQVCALHILIIHVYHGQENHDRPVSIYLRALTTVPDPQTGLK